jgi:hypothetical protein
VQEISEDNQKLVHTLKSNPTQSPKQNQHYQALLKTMSAQADSLRSTNELLEQKVVEMTLQLDELQSQNNDILVQELDNKVCEKTSGERKKRAGLAAQADSLRSTNF